MTPRIKSEPAPLPLQPIGIIHTPYKDKYQAPRQPGVDDETIEGVITLYPHQNFEQALEDLAGFEKIWIISWFHHNADWKPKVLPPRSGRTKRGVFATRSPHRPNPIGISVCTLLGIEGLTIRVENPDLLDETPILDIKPYIPYADAFPDVRFGWLEEFHNKEKEHRVTSSSLVTEQSKWLEKQFGVHLLDHVVKILTRDPYPHPFRRIKQNTDGSYTIGVKSWRVIYTIAGEEVHLEQIVSGYTQQELVRASHEQFPLHDEAAHREYHKRFINGNISNRLKQ